MVDKNGNEIVWNEDKSWGQRVLNETKFSTGKLNFVIQKVATYRTGEEYISDFVVIKRFGGSKFQQVWLPISSVDQFKEVFDGVL